ncbi:MAG TPA: MBL fold metallo-hydrolase [Chloroflexaceae bacterium]|nr:MBL fold metallo-hydrolase [Chloroflexaceae bacterium]
MLERLAPGVARLAILPRHGINAYLVGDVLVDAGVRPVAPLLLRALRRRPPVAHALTHGHPDHQGASRAVCVAFGIPLWCAAPDAPAMAAGDPGALLPPWLGNGLLALVTGGPGHPVTRHLGEGDRLGDFVVLETPGHTPGHVSLWREADGVLIVGDVLANQHPVTGRVGLIEPLPRFTCDPARNRASARRLAALGPRLACFGHGPPLREPRVLARFVDELA